MFDCPLYVDRMALIVEVSVRRLLEDFCLVQAGFVHIEMRE